MNNTRCFKSAVFIAAFLTFSASCFAQESAPQNAPDLLPGVEHEMLSPDYWIALQPDADEIIMDAAGIARFNAAVREKKVEFEDYYGKDDPLKRNFVESSANGLLMNPIEPLTFPAVMDVGEVKKRLERNRGLLIEPMELYGQKEFHDGRLAPWSLSMKQELIEKMNLDALPDKIHVRYAVLVRHGLLRQYPTEVPGYSDRKSMLDRFQLTDLGVGYPLAVLHESKDGDYLFVASELAWGWIAAGSISIGSREEIQAIVDDDSFIMAAAHRVPVYGDPEFRNFSHFAYFSATIPLKKKSDAVYVVRMPCRAVDGSLVIEDGYVKPDADVSVGYLPYTKRNVLNQLFKLWGTPYGWHGQDNKRDCAITMRVLLRCFGIVVGKNPSFILNSSPHKYLIDPNLSSEEKTAEVAKLDPVITIVGNSGHVALLLGKAANGKVYFMHQAGWGYKDEDGVQRIVGRVTINWTGHRFYSIDAPNVYTTMKP